MKIPPIAGRRWLRRGMGATGLLGCAAVAVPWLTRGPAAAVPQVGRTTAGAPSARDDGSFRVLTLNAAHGRKDGAHQALCRRSTIESNLAEIAEMLRRERPDVVALQEADGPSAWSGGFNHVEYLAGESALSWWVRGEHVSGLDLSYGTAILAEAGPADPLSITFRPSWPTFSKGFVVAAVPWPEPPGVAVDVVSVHLDFSRASVRANQTREMAERLTGRSRPIVVMGDFNCDWDGGEATLREFAADLDLVPCRPAGGDTATFPGFGSEIDWILISDELRCVSCEVLPDVLSDHRAVVAELELR